MVSRRVIDEVLSQKTLALVGVSRNGAGFGNTIRKELAGSRLRRNLLSARRRALRYWRLTGSNA